MRVRYDMITCYAVRAAGESQEFLQLHRVPHDFMGGTWQAVSGGIEPGESAWQAALRELAEEAGLKPVELYRLPIVNMFYIAEQDTLWHSIPFCAIVDVQAKIRLNAEHDAVRWIGRQSLDQSFMWATDRAALSILCRDILDDGAAKPYLRIAI